MPVVSIRSYAKMRGVSDTAVHKAIKRGVLQKALITEGGAKKIDAEVADQEWPFNKETTPAKLTKKSLLAKAMANAKPKKLPTQTDAQTEDGDELEGKDLDPTADARGMYFTGRAKKEDLNARLLEMKLKREEGTVVEVDVVKKAWVNVANKVRTKILAIPSKASQRLLGFTHEHREALEQIVREALEDLANGETERQAHDQPA